ncbi:type VI secretion system baseplate subunit TssF, partial (plasmid) [Chromobacterium amazonense]|uniref:type VI secretion system baseplate subunit TssF n=1 Tax=Chromobacterium amazonense TaxID=1382803 RepID=UPI00237ED54A
RYRVERGQAVHAPAINGVVCKFRSAYPVDLYPLSLKDARLELTSGSPYLRQLAPDAAALLTLECHTHGGLTLNHIGLTSLRFFLDGEPALMHLLYELLLSQVLRIRVGDGSDDPARTFTLPAKAIRPVGFGRDEGMLEYDERSFMGYRLLTEYFCYPEKFLFVDIAELDKAAARLNGEKLVLQLVLGDYPDSERHHRLLTQLQPQHLKLGCTPVVNLF